jgi:hypothetical protein
MNSRLRAFGAFWWDFIVGDDWRIALGVVIGIAATASIAAAGVAAWWLLPIIVAVVLLISVHHATR